MSSRALSLAETTHRKGQLVTKDVCEGDGFSVTVVIREEGFSKTSDRRLKGSAHGDSFQLD